MIHLAPTSASAFLHLYVVMAGVLQSWRVAERLNFPTILICVVSSASRLAVFHKTIVLARKLPNRAVRHEKLSSMDTFASFHCHRISWDHFTSEP
jgi:hypothetical protein